MTNPHNNRSASPRHPSTTSTWCRACTVRGYIWDEGEDCHACDGVGFVEQKEPPSCLS